VHELRVAHVSTLTPRACGIATFTRDLALALAHGRLVAQNVFVAVEEDGVSREYDPKPACIVWQNDELSYQEAARLLNRSDVDVVHLEHEYGIYGGNWGEYVLGFAAELQKPLVVTFHTVMQNPPEKAAQVLEKLAGLADAVVVTVPPARDLLFEIYDVPKNKTLVIPHGSPESRTGQNKAAKAVLGLEGRTTVTTLGLINPGKGIEYGIQAVHRIATKYPNIVYLVVGQTHPVVRKHHGEQYREGLQDLTRSLRLEANVKFIDRYLSEGEKELYYLATDIYLAPYVGRDQVSSGTITEALGFGKCVVSTPSTFAQAALANGRGLFCDFNSPESIAEKIQEILNNPSLRLKLERKALDFSRKLTWREAAKAYCRAYQKVLEARAIAATMPPS
jgi:glycosyltransferase involved in cell wall biosynthesis